MLIALIRTIIVPVLGNLVAFKHAKAPCIRKGFDTVKSIIIFALLTILMPSIALSASTTPAGNNKPTNILEITPPITPRLEKYYLGQLFGKNKLYISLCDATITERCAKPRIIAENGGRIFNGITISPYIGGEWRINENYHIEFIPATYWLAKTNYTITIDKNSLPIFSSLNYNIISFQTQPLAPNIKEMGYIQDEYDLEKKFVQVKIEWNYPVEQKSFEERLKLSVENTQSLLPLSITLNDKKTEATVTTTLTALTDKERVASLVISEGVKPLYGGKALSHSDIEEMDRTYMVGKENFHKYHEQTLIPDIYSYFKVKNADFTIVKNEKNIPEQIIVINTNVPISPEELKNNLQLLLLPKDKAGSFMGAPSQKDYQWKSSAEITKEVFDQSMLVNFDSLPTYTKYSSTNSIKVNMPPGRFLMLTLKRGTKSYGDLILGQDYQKIIRVNNFLSEIKIMSEGSLLSLFGEKKLSIYSLGVSTLNIEINQIAKHNINHLISQTYQDSKFHQPNFRNWSFNEYNISKVFEEVRELNSEGKNIPQYSTLDFNQYLKSKSFAPAGNEENKGLFFVKISDLNSNVQDKRLILITDIGFLVKTQQDGMQEIFVSSITKQAPLKGAIVEIIGLNGQAIATATTDSSGHASLPNVRNYMHEKSPVAYIIKHKNDLAFMPYGRRDREVNYSKFDVSGITASAEGLKAYLFSDRGIYKPGEQGNIGIIVKQANFADNLENMPLELEVTNPRGQIFDKKKITLNKEGLVDYLFQTNDSSPTGTYNFALYIAKDRYRGSMLGNVAVKVEEFLPDRMKIQSRFKVPSKKLYVSPENLTVEVDLLNLYGSPAVGRTVEATINLVQTGFTNLGLPDYKDYIFYSGTADERHFTEKLNTSITDNNGHTEFDLNLKQYSNAPYRVDFLAEGFEPDSGRSVKTTNTILVSSLPYIIGFKPSSNLAYLKRHDECNLEFIALDNEGNKISIPQLEVELKRINHVNSLTYQADGSYAYQSLPIETSITKSVIAANTGLSYLYKLSTQEVGDYAIYLRDKQDPDKQGRVFSHIEFTVIGEGNVSASLTKNSSLKIKTNKADYKAGEEIEVSATAPYIGYGLIAIETDKVHNFTWFKAHTSNSTHKITVPKDFEGKGYINVQFIRSLASSDIFISPFSYATIPFTANIEKREQKIIIDVPKKIQPGHDLTIKYRTKRPGKIAIFAVDEGILLFGRYQTPNPINYFINSRALEVTTAHVLDLILPEYSLLRRYSSAAGDGFIDYGKNLNPFKRKTQPPVAFWSGILDSATKEQELSFPIPDYFNGTIRVMAVASNQEAIGSTAETTLVQGEFVISPNLPLFATPGDEFTIPITIANNVAGSGNSAKVQINAQPSSHLELLDCPKEMLIAEGKDSTAQVRVKVKEILGSASIQITAALGENKASITSTTSIRPASPKVTTVDTGYTNNKELDIVMSRKIYPDFGKVKVSLSLLPVGIITGLKEYLDNYPYGCTEQLVSQNFPNVLLYDQQDLVSGLELQRKKLYEGLTQVFTTISERQKYDGSFSVWGNYGASDDFTTVYTMHFFTEALTKNLPVPDHTFSAGIDYLKNMANKAMFSKDQAREKAYAIYILTRNNVVTTHYIANVINYLETAYKDQWHNDLVAIYLAATYKMLHMIPEANQLLEQFNLSATIKADVQATTSYNYSFYSNLIKYSQYIYLLSLHFPERLDKFTRDLSASIANSINTGYNTIASSYAIMASLAYSNTMNSAVDNYFTLQQYGPQASQAPELNLKAARITTTELGVETNKLKIISTAPNFFYQLIIAGFDKKVGDTREENGIELDRQYLDEQGAPVSKVKLGSTVNVLLTIRSASNATLPNIAVVDLLPGGFELDSAPNIKTKLLESWEPYYVDKRDDRVVIFGSVPDYKVQYQYKIKAVNKGTFTTPACYGESMYIPSIYLRGVIGSIVIE